MSTNIIGIQHHLALIRSADLAQNSESAARTSHQEVENRIHKVRDSVERTDLPHFINGVKADMRRVEQVAQTANDAITRVQTSVSAMEELSNALASVRENTVAQTSDRFTEIQQQFVDEVFRDLIAGVREVLAETRIDEIDLSSSDTRTKELNDEGSIYFSDEEQAFLKGLEELSQVDIDTSVERNSVGENDHSDHFNSTLNTIDEAFANAFDGVLGRIQERHTGLISGQEAIRDEDVAKARAREIQHKIVSGTTSSIASQANIGGHTALVFIE